MTVIPARTRRKYRLVIRKLGDDDALRDYKYWMSRPPRERIEAVEILRLQWYKLHNERPKRLRRVYRAVKRA